MNELNKIIESIKLIDNGVLLEELKKAIENQIEENLDKRENFMYRDYIDDYLYSIYFKDGSRDIQCKGCRAYEIFLQDDAVSIYLRTKDLKRTETLLMYKENGMNVFA